MCISKGRMALYTDNKTKVGPSRCCAVPWCAAHRMARGHDTGSLRVLDRRAKLSWAASTRLRPPSSAPVQVRLAKEAQLCAYAAIEADPQSDVAHHLMGRCADVQLGRCDCGTHLCCCSAVE